MPVTESKDIPAIRLTQYSHGAGCGCKIAPDVLAGILSGSLAAPDNKNLLVGNHSRDDAAVYDMQNGTALISTTDFFMPIVDDAFDFGRIAAANAISDVYAMGGSPLLAIAILGWPVKTLPVEIASRVIDGARFACAEAGIPIAGGHSIDSPEPIFGLAVNGLVRKENIKQNNTAREGDYLFLTKKVGVGILTTAEKRSKLLQQDEGVARNQMILLNKVGAALGEIAGVHAMTDVTGFGLAGHLSEMAGESKLSAEIYWSKIPRITDLDYYFDNRLFPDGTNRNWNSYGNEIDIDVSLSQHQAFMLLADPQTNGGLLISVGESSVHEVVSILNNHGLSEFTSPIGRFFTAGDKLIRLRH